MTTLITLTELAAILYTLAAIFSHIYRVKTNEEAVIEAILADPDPVLDGVKLFPAYTALKVDDLRKLCKAAGIVYRNVHGKGKHLKKAEMIAALEAL